MNLYENDLSKLAKLFSAKATNVNSTSIKDSAKAAAVKSVSNQPEVDIDEINEQLGKGNRDALSQLEELGISYTLAERDNGYTIKYSYNGTNYTIAYFAPQTTEEESTPTETQPAQPTQTPTTEETTETGDSSADNDDTTMAQIYTTEILQNVYHFTDAEMEQYFEWYEVKNEVFDVKGWIIKPELTINGKEISTLDDLLEALDREDPTKYGGVSAAKPESIVGDYSVNNPASSIIHDIEPDERFDYTVVGNLESSPDELYNEDGVSEQDRFIMAQGVIENDIDFGGYDDVLEDLTNMKPQLKNYIKTELEAKGYTYNEDVVDKYLNAYISTALQDVLKDCRAWNAIASVSEFSQTMPQKPTMEDVITQIIAKIELELGNSYKGIIPNKIASSEFNDSYVTNYSYLLDTADYFLTEDEKKLKVAMELAEGNSIKTVAEAEVEGWIDTYSVRMKAVLKQRYSGNIALSDSQLDSIIQESKERTLKNMKPNNNSEYYELDIILKYFKATCDSEARELVQELYD